MEARQEFRTYSSKFASVNVALLYVFHLVAKSGKTFRSSVIADTTKISHNVRGPDIFAAKSFLFREKIKIREKMVQRSEWFVNVEAQWLAWTGR